MQYFTDFSEYTTGVQPSDWTQRFTTSAGSYLVQDQALATGGKVLEISGLSTTTRRLISWDAVNSDTGRADAEVLIRFRYSANPTDLYAFYRASGGASTEQGYRNGKGSASNTSKIAKYEGGTYQGLQSSTPSEFLVANTWMWLRARVDSAHQHSWKMWLDGDPEPIDWQAVTSNAVITGAGWVGIFTYTTEAGAVREVDVFSVGTNGDTAPTEAPASGPTITNVPNMTQGVEATITGTGFGAGGPTAGTLEYGTTSQGPWTAHAVDTWADTSIIITPNLPVSGEYYWRVTNNDLEEGVGGPNTITTSEIVATGGIITSIEESGITYKVHTFTESEVFQITAGSADVEYLIVAGGGGGGPSGATGGGSGGGAGGVLTSTILRTVGSYPVVVGLGGLAGVGSSATDGGDGEASSIFDIIALGGGGGVHSTRASGRNGGSGSGAAGYQGGTGGVGTTGQGTDGGSSAAFGSGAPSAGGGGKSSAGGDVLAASETVSGAGGIGYSGTSFGVSGLAGGGSGGSGNGTGNTVGTAVDGGGTGGSSAQSGNPAEPNTGGGGGGGGSSDSDGGEGGSGIVIVKYETTSASVISFVPNMTNGIQAILVGLNFGATAGTLEYSTTSEGPWTVHAVDTWSDTEISIIPNLPSEGQYFWKVTNTIPEEAVGGPNTVSIINNIEAVGGTITDININGIDYRYHTFLTSGTLDIISGSGIVEYLIVAGGGGAGGRASGGAGAGGLINSSQTLGNYTYDITVGMGGTGTNTLGNNGGNSSLTGSLDPGLIIKEAIGGGGGYGDNGSNTGEYSGADGGSGGGAGSVYNEANGAPGGSGTLGQGNDGGSAYGAAGNNTTGGGGGFTTPGQNGIVGQAGNGGNGFSAVEFLDSLYTTLGNGSGFFAGGGGGGTQDTAHTQGIGGSGGGGSASGVDGVPGEPGDDNTGGGAGGNSGLTLLTGSSGGSGIVVIRYEIQTSTAPNITFIPTPLTVGQTGVLITGTGFGT